MQSILTSSLLDLKFQVSILYRKMYRVWADDNMVFITPQIIKVCSLIYSCENSVKWVILFLETFSYSNTYNLACKHIILLVLKV